MYLTMGSQLRQVSGTHKDGSVDIDSPSVVVDLVTIAWGVNDVQPQTDTVFFDD